MSKEIKRVGLRMPVELYKKLEVIGQNYGIPVANLINFIVAMWIENQLNTRDKMIEVVREEVKRYMEKGDNIDLLREERK